MANYLIKTTEVYRCDSEKEANNFVAEAKKNNLYTVTKSTVENRQTKQKGEIVDEWKRVTLTKEFNSEKEPYGIMHVLYSTNLTEEEEEV